VVSVDDHVRETEIVAWLCLHDVMESGGIPG
jgi:hypothetical protein